MMISAQQIKAARAMMDWTQDMLAEETGLSPNTICSLEKGHQSIRSLMDVRKTFEDKGFEFIGNTGLMRRTVDEARVYHGAGSCDKFYEDIFSTLKEKGGEVAAAFRAQEFLTHSLGVANTTNLERLEQLGKYATSIKCLYTEGRHSSIALPSYEFRAATQNPFGMVASILYGDKTAVIITDCAEYIFLVMRAIDRTQTNWQTFTRCWQAAIPLSMHASLKK